MKKFLLLALFFCAVFKTFAGAPANACMVGNSGGAFGNGDICQNFKNNDGANSYQYIDCCACSYTVHTGCPVVTNTPINSGLIFLILAGCGLGAYTFKKNVNATQTMA